MACLMVAAAHALAGAVEKKSRECISLSPMDKSVAHIIAQAVLKAAPAKFNK